MRHGDPSAGAMARARWGKGAAGVQEASARARGRRLRLRPRRCCAGREGLVRVGLGLGHLWAVVRRHALPVSGWPPGRMVGRQVAAAAPGPWGSARRARCLYRPWSCFWSGRGTSGAGRLLWDLDGGSFAAVALLPRWRCVSAGCGLAAMCRLAVRPREEVKVSVTPGESLIAWRPRMSPSSLGAVVELSDLRYPRVHFFG